MLEAGEDPLYIARRLVRFASEDIGNADPQALTVAVAAKDAVHFIGMPEGNTALAQAAIYLATAPKSNAVYVAYSAAAADAAQRRRRAGAAAPAQRADQTDEAAGLRQGLPVRARRGGRRSRDMECLPPAHQGRRFYEPTDRGFEQEIKRRLDDWQRSGRNRRSEPDSRLRRHRHVRRRRGLVTRHQLRNLAEHLDAQRQDEREAIVALHPADRDADELAVAVQHAAARHAGMAVGQARHEVVRASAGRRSRSRG